MPELAELEAYRSDSARALGRAVSTARVADPSYLKGGLTPEALQAAATGRCFDGVRRVGKLLLFHLDAGPEVGIRLGMTGHLVLDGTDAADPTPRRPRVAGAWDRVAFRFADGGELVVADRRRLGGVSLDPDLSTLGPDLLSLTEAQLVTALAASAQPVKARLLDQSLVAGVGNLGADEALWCAGIAPARPASSLDAGELGRLHRCLLSTVAHSVALGTSRRGPLGALRTTGSCCPEDGARLLRSRIGGRTTWSCPRHQR